MQVPFASSATLPGAPKTIIGFDSWTAGSHHYQRLVPALERLGYELLLIHIGSWGHDTDRPAEERIGPLKVRDISYYGKKSFGQILQEEAPSAVLFLSTRAFAHMSFNRYARHMGIPTCHLYHGIVGVQAFESTHADLQTSLGNRLKLARVRIGKNLRLLIPNYARALLDTRAPLRCWIEIVTECVSKLRYIHDTSRLVDTITDTGCVYIDADASHMNRVYGLASEDIFSVGNPDISAFGMDADDLLTWRGDSAGSREIVYIETALVEVGSIFSSDEAFRDHLLHCRQMVEASNNKLVVKLHPATERRGIGRDLEALGFEMCSRDEFVDRLKRCAAAITEPSTAALIPALLGVPLLLCQVGKMHRQNYGSVLTSYPSALHLTDTSDVGELLRDIAADRDPARLTEWVEHHSGSLPAQDMPDRVAEILHHTVIRNTAASMGSPLIKAGVRP